MPRLKPVQYTPKPIPLYTVGRSSAKGSRRGCLCDGTEGVGLVNTYSKKCCKGHLYNQGIGIIEGPAPVKRRAFSKAFSNGFS